MNTKQISGNVIPQLSFESDVAATSGEQPTVLSCGGIFIPKRKLSLDMKKWQQIVTLPGPELSVKIFGYSGSLNHPLTDVLRKQLLN